MLEWYETINDSTIESRESDNVYKRDLSSFVETMTNIMRWKKDKRFSILKVLQLFNDYHYNSVKDIEEEKANNDPITSDKIIIRARECYDQQLTFKECIERLSPMLDKLKATSVVVPKSPTVNTPVKIMEFNLHHPTGLTQPISDIINLIIADKLEHDAIRDVMFYRCIDHTFYYIDSNKALVSISCHWLESIMKGLSNKLLGYVNEYLDIYTQENIPVAFKSFSIVDGVVITSKTKLLVWEAEQTTQKNAFNQIIEWLRMEDKPHKVDKLFNKYQEMEGEEKGKREFMETMKKMAIDISHSVRDPPDVKTFQIGQLIRSSFKEGNVLCYYIYNGTIPDTTRNPGVRCSRK